MTIYALAQPNTNQDGNSRFETLHIYAQGGYETGDFLPTFTSRELADAWLNKHPEVYPTPTLVELQLITI